MSDLIADGFAPSFSVRPRETENVIADLDDLYLAVSLGQRLVEEGRSVAAAVSRLSGRVARTVSNAERTATERIAAAETAAAEQIAAVKADAEAQVREAREQYGRLVARAHEVTAVQMANPQGFYVYCLWSPGQTVPCYVGSSRNVYGRLGTHVTDRNKPGWDRVTVSEYETWADMRAAERALIEHYQPRWNVVGIRAVSA